MEPEELEEGAESILGVVENLGVLGARAARSVTSEAAVARFGRTLAEASADAAELFAKMAMQRRLGHYPFSHDLNELASSLEERDTERRWRDVATLLRRLNGYTRRDHKTMNGRVSIDFDDVGRAGERFAALVPALVTEFEDAAQTPALAETANSALAELHDLYREATDLFPSFVESPPDGFGEMASAVREVLSAVRSAYERGAAV